MMKSIFAALLLAITSTLFAQTKNEISVGFGPSFFGWGDMTGAALTTTYNYQFDKHFGVEPRLISSAAWNTSGIGYVSYYNGKDMVNPGGYNYSQTGYIGAAASLVYTPFVEKGSFFKLKSGFLMGSMAHSYGSNLTGTYSSVYTEFSKENLFGLIYTAHLRILNREKFFFGTELSMLTSFSEGYYNCDGFVWNFMGGLKF